MAPPGCARRPRERARRAGTSPASARRRVPGCRAWRGPRAWRSRRSCAPPRSCAPGSCRACPCAGGRARTPGAASGRRASACPAAVGELGEVAAVGGDRQRRQPALDAHLDQERVDRVRERRVLGHVIATPRPAGPSAAEQRLVARTLAAEHRRQLDGALRRSDSCRASVVVRPSTTRLPTTRCASACAATCGRWVTHSTWW